ncbi:MAG: hypothetical protein E7532_06505 [Ruminococcaceae bacterium]|nr:hypothetical protein [Oscillospiraceae bacterium]
MKFFATRRMSKHLSVFTCLLLVFAFMLSACNSNSATDKDGATQDSVVATEIDTQTFVFSSGIKVGGTDVSGMAFDEAFQKVESAAEATVNDFTLKVKADEKEFSYTKKDFKISFNVEEKLMEAAKFCESTGYSAETATDFALEVVVDKDSVMKIVNAIAKETDVKAVDSTFAVDGDRVNISREKAGKSLDKDALCQKILEEVKKLAKGSTKTATIEAVVNEVEPKRHYEDFDGTIKLIASYNTYSTNTPNGNHNMNLALESCDGSVIEPGEVWSFNECTGNSNLTSLGYLPATVIINGKFEEGVGGGLCQASSTIYNAALLANMVIEERYCHQFQSSYVPAGRDATIDYPYLDLKLSNPTDYPMYMQCYMEGTELTVNIYGWDDPSFDEIEIESYVYGATEEGYRAAATRVYYLDGKEVGREELHSSWYDYPKEETSTAATTAPKPTKPKEPKPTKPKATDPKETTPKVTQPATTVPSVTVPSTVVSDPVEPTTAKPQATSPTSQNNEQIETATAHY